MFGKKKKTRAEIMAMLGSSEEAVKEEAMNTPLIRLVIGQTLTNWQVEAIIKMQKIKLPGMAKVSLLGSGQGVILVVAYFLWLADPELRWKGPNAATFMLCIIGLLKSYLRGPRPYWLSPKVKTLDPTLETSFGFPSGHTAGIAAVLGVYFFHYFPHIFDATADPVNYYESQKGWLAWLALFLVVGFSRVYTGSHFMHDVLGGGIVGLFCLFLVYDHKPSNDLAEALKLFCYSIFTFLCVIGSNLPKNTNLDIKTQGDDDDEDNVGNDNVRTTRARARAATVTPKKKQTTQKSKRKFIKDLQIRFKLVYEGLTGAGFALGLSIVHILKYLFITYSKSGDFKSGPLSYPQAIVGLIGIVLLAHCVKVLPEDANGNRGMGSLIASCLCYSCILVWSCFLLPYICLYL